MKEGWSTSGPHMWSFLMASAFDEAQRPKKVRPLSMDERRERERMEGCSSPTIEWMERVLRWRYSHRYYVVALSERVRGERGKHVGPSTLCDTREIMRVHVCNTFAHEHPHDDVTCTTYGVSPDDSFPELEEQFARRVGLAVVRGHHDKDRLEVARLVCRLSGLGWGKEGKDGGATCCERLCECLDGTRPCGLCAERPRCLHGEPTHILTVIAATLSDVIRLSSVAVAAAGVRVIEMTATIAKREVVKDILSLSGREMA